MISCQVSVISLQPSAVGVRASGFGYRAAAWLGDGTGLIIGAHDVHCLKDISVGGYEVAFNRVFVSVESLVRKAEKLCVELHIENPGGGLLLSPLELREFLDEMEWHLGQVVVFTIDSACC
ncbi:MAG: hypothetical protein IIC51_01810 [Planctomycetes bacterium]|nr:hypothetical protein [Planctomycetota bacterium]